MSSQKDGKQQQNHSNDESPKDQRISVLIEDLPVNNNSDHLSSAIDEDFIRQLFADYQLSSSPDAVIIKTKIGRNGHPFTNCLIKFDTYEQAIKAINDLNYTKLDGVPIRMTLVDKETKDIMRSGQTCLFIKNLDPDIEVSHLHDAFANFGEIISCNIPTDLVTKNGEKKYVSRGYGYVTFRNIEDAKQAMIDLKDASINGRPIEITFNNQNRSSDEKNFQKVYIKNIPSHYTDPDLKELFSEYGTPLSCNVMLDDDGKSKQYGFCRMSTHEEAVKAIEGLNGREIEGIPIECSRAMSRLERIEELEKMSNKWREENFEKYKGRNICVRDFDESVTDEELKQLFSYFGKVENALVMRDENGKSKQLGFVLFENIEDAKKCIQHSSLISIHGKFCTIFLAMTREQRMKEIMKNIKK